MEKTPVDQAIEKLVVAQFKEDRFWYKTKDLKISYSSAKTKKIENGYETKMIMTIEIVDYDGKNESKIDHEERFEKIYEYLRVGKEL